MPHIHDLYDFTVGIFIVHDGKVLLVNHPRYNKWIQPGGHVELNEDPEEAVYREAKEETGLDIEFISRKLNIITPGTKFLINPNYMDVHEANPPHKHINLIYFTRSKSKNFTLSPEHSAMKWFTPADLNRAEYKLSDAVKFYANEAIKEAA